MSRGRASDPGWRARRTCAASGPAAGDCACWSPTDDPFTADAAANGRLWQERLGAAVEVVPGAGHFNRPEEPPVLAELLRWYAADSA